MNAPKLADRMNASPTVAMNTRGANFSTVVMICTAEMLRSPARLTAAGSHSPTSAMTTDQALPCEVFQNTST